MMVGIAIPSFSKATKNRFGSRMKNCREIPGGRKPALSALAGRDILRCGLFHRDDQEYCERPRRARDLGHKCRNGLRRGHDGTWGLGPVRACRWCAAIRPHARQVSKANPPSFDYKPAICPRLLAALPRMWSR